MDTSKERGEKDIVCISSITSVIPGSRSYVLTQQFVGSNFLAFFLSFLSLWLGSLGWSGGVQSNDGPRVRCVGWSDGSSGRPCTIVSRLVLAAVDARTHNVVVDYVTCRNFGLLHTDCPRKTVESAKSVERSGS